MSNKVAGKLTPGKDYISSSHGFDALNRYLFPIVVNLNHQMDHQYLPHSNIVRPKIKLFAGNSLSMKGATDCGSEVSRSDQQPNIIIR